MPFIIYNILSVLKWRRRAHSANVPDLHSTFICCTRTFTQSCTSPLGNYCILRNRSPTLSSEMVWLTCFWCIDLCVFYWKPLPYASNLWEEERNKEAARTSKQLSFFGAWRSNKHKECFKVMTPSCGCKSTHVLNRLATHWSTSVYPACRQDYVKYGYVFSLTDTRRALLNAVSTYLV